MFPYY